MTVGYVIFSTQSVFDTAHVAAKAALGLPRVGSVSGKPMPSNQQTIDVTKSYPHPTNDTVMAFINGGWPEDHKTGFVFKTKEEVSEYLPSEVL